MWRIESNPLFQFDQRHRKKSQHGDHEPLHSGQRCGLENELERREGNDCALQGNAQDDAEQQPGIGEKADLEQGMGTSHVQGVHEL